MEYPEDEYRWDPRNDTDLSKRKAVEVLVNRRQHNGLAAYGGGGGDALINSLETTRDLPQKKQKLASDQSSYGHNRHCLACEEKNKPYILSASLNSLTLADMVLK